MTPLQFIMKFKHIRKIAVFKKVYFMRMLVEEVMLLRTAAGFKCIWIQGNEILF